MQRSRFRQVAVDLEPEAFAAVDALARRGDVTVPDVVRQALNLLFALEQLTVLAAPTKCPYQRSQRLRTIRGARRRPHHRRLAVAWPA